MIKHPPISRILTAVAAATMLAGTGTGDPAGAGFPGVNGKIAFDSAREGNLDIYAMRPDGTGVTNLTDHPASDSEPAWSPDGSKIAFLSDRGGTGEIWVMNADGSGPTQLTDHPAADFEQAWSPDGTKLAFTTNRDGNFELYVMNADGSGPTRLTNDAAADTPGGVVAGRDEDRVHQCTEAATSTCTS